MQHIALLSVCLVHSSIQDGLLPKKVANEGNPRSINRGRNYSSSIVMPCMYFSGEDSNSITYDDPANKWIRIDPSLYARVQDDNKHNIRVFLDTPLFEIRNIPHNQNLPTLEHIVSNHNASISTGSTTMMLALNYVTNAMITAEFRRSAVTNSQIHIWPLLIVLLKIAIWTVDSYCLSIIILLGMLGMWKKIFSCIFFSSNRRYHS